MMKAKYLVRRHHLDPRRPYCVHTVSIDVFSEMMLMLYEMFTGKTMGASEMFLNSFCDEMFKMAMEESFHVPFVGKLGVLSHDPLRNEKIC